MKLIWGLLRPDLLTHKVGLLSVAQSHWVARKMKIYDGMHEWLPMYCPCQIDLGLDDEPWQRPRDERGRFTRAA